MINLKNWDLVEIELQLNIGKLKIGNWYMDFEEIGIGEYKLKMKSEIRKLELKLEIVKNGKMELQTDNCFSNKWNWKRENETQPKSRKCKLENSIDNRKNVKIDNWTLRIGSQYLKIAKIENKTNWELEEFEVKLQNRNLKITHNTKENEKWNWAIANSELVDENWKLKIRNWQSTNL